jgi:ribonuclease P protein component
MNQDLKRAEILKSKIKLDLVFKEGKSITQFPIKCIFKEIDVEKNSEKIQVGFSVPKRLFKKAVDRNLLKRRLREAYRRNKQILKEPIELKDKQLLLFLIYLANKPLSYQEIEDKIVLILQELKEQYEQAI